MSDVNDIRAVVRDFPRIYDKARRDWEVFRAADRLTAYSPDQRALILDWYEKFPRLWQGIRPNWMYDIGADLPPGYDFSEAATADQDKIRLLHEVDAWTNYLEANRSGLGLVPLVIAGVLLVAALASTAGVLWAIGYVKEQNNVSEVINQVASGVLPPQAIAEIRKESASGVAASLGAATNLLIVGAILYFGYPYFKGLFR